jgi:ribose transport system ATP-binding protein
VSLDDREITSVRAAMLLGISFSHQETSLVPEWSVADHFRTIGGDLNGAWHWLTPEVRGDQLIRSLSGHEHQCLEVARALTAGRRAILADEPTAMLGADEKRKVLEGIAQAAASGRIVVWVTHDLPSALRYANRIVALREGAVVCDAPSGEMTVEKILDAMSNHASSSPHELPQKRAVQAGTSKSIAFRIGQKVPIEVGAGEIIGLTGSARSRVRDVLRGALGLSPYPGLSVRFDGKPLRGGPSAALRAGIAYMSRERGTEWLFDRQSVAFNVAAGTFGEVCDPFSLTDTRLYSYAGDWAGKFDVKAPSLRMDIEGLSGGNRQKTVLARLAAMRPAFMLLDEPFSGVDRPTRRRLFDMLRSMADAGVGIAIYSQESDDLLAATDRVYVMTRDAVEVFDSSEAGPAQVERAILNEQAVVT